MPLDLSGLDDQAPAPGGQATPVPGKLDLSLLDDPSLTAAPTPAPAKTVAATPPLTGKQAYKAIQNAASDGVLAFQRGLNDLGGAFSHHVMNLPHGGAQFIQNTVDAGLQRLPDNPVSRWWHNDTTNDNAWLAKREADYQARVGNSIPAYIGAIAGELGPFMMSGGSSMLESAGKPATAAAEWLSSKVGSPALQTALKYMGLAGAGGTQGALAALAAPVNDASDYWKAKASQVKTGALVGGAVPPALAAAGAAARGVKNAAMPLVAPESYVGKQIANMLGDDAQTVLGNLQSYKTLVPGSTPSAAQVGENTKLLQIEKANRNTVPGAEVFANRESANNAARWGVINDAAKDDSVLTQAVAARDAWKQPVIDKLLNNPATAKPVEISPILKQLDALESGSLGTDPVVKSAVRGLRQDLQDAAAKTDLNRYTWTPSQLKSLNPDAPYVDPALLDGYRQNVRNFLSKYASNGAVSSKQEAAFEPIKNQIINAIEGANPGYKGYLKGFAQKSQPINTMEAAQQLQELLGGKAQNAQGDPMISAAGYQSALNRAMKGQPYGINPQTRGALEAIADDLQRSTRSNSLRTPGSDTAYNIQAQGALGKLLYGPSFNGSSKATRVAAGAIGSFIPGVGWMGGYLGSGELGATVGKHVNQAAAKLLNDPQALAAALQGQLTPQQAAVIPEIVKLLPNVASYEAARVAPQSKPANP
jgi:hypothetical protein